MKRTAPREAARRYPPLVLLSIGVLLTATVLPSALNLPLPNPSQTLEYAPVPSDEEGAPPGGSLSSLGLGSGRGLGQGGIGDMADEISGPTGRGARPSVKRCIGNPPRQTEDPLAPPCSAFFEGNNFGATYQGVTKDEVRILSYSDAFSRPCDSFLDLSDPSGEKGSDIDYRRAYMRYFNDRFQTYNRYVRVIIHWGCGATPEGRKADAQTGWSVVRPFAVFPWAVRENTDSYLEATAARGVISFISPSSGRNKIKAFFNRYPRMLYSYGPTIEHQADLYASYVCTKVVPYRVSFSGNAIDDDQPRRLGQLYADDPNVPEFRVISELVADKIKRCGGEIVLTRKVPWFNTANESVNNRSASPTQNAAENMAAFKTSRVTTILWTGLTDILHSRAAAGTDYRPELVVMGIGGMDSNEGGTLQEPSVWRQAWTVSQLTYMSLDRTQNACFRAAREADPAVTESNSRYECDYSYPSMRQIFTGIQVAGPRLNPTTLDQGFHAIPRIASNDPGTPACFYDQGDYSCVKDAIAEWWDPSGPARGALNQPGCWRIPEGGKRFLLGTWPNENVDAKQKPDDLCNNSG